MIIQNNCFYSNCTLIIFDVKWKTFKMAIKRNLIKFNKNFYESCAWKNKSVVCGIDEVGRGCLAGPLVAAAVILPSSTRYKLLKDSKILSKKELLLAYDWITKNCKYNIGIVAHYEIDKFNIWQATLLAMKRAVIHLLSISNIRPTVILIDAMPLKLTDTSFHCIPIHHFPKGESKSTSIAAASIVAKATRDAIMKRLDLIFPGYNLAQHKGYCTKYHQQAIYNQKHSIVHRLSFLGKLFIFNDEYDYKKQLSLC